MTIQTQVNCYESFELLYLRTYMLSFQVIKIPKTFIHVLYQGFNLKKIFFQSIMKLINNITANQ